MNISTIRQELYKKIDNMNREDFVDFIDSLKRYYYKKHSHGSVYVPDKFYDWDNESLNG